MWLLFALVAIPTINQKKKNKVIWVIANTGVAWDHEAVKGRIYQSALLARRFGIWKSSYSTTSLACLVALFSFLLPLLPPAAIIYAMFHDT